MYFFGILFILQLLLLFMCHSSWDIRKAAYGCTKRILFSAPKLFEILVVEYSENLTVVGEKVLAKSRYKFYECVYSLLLHSIIYMGRVLLTIDFNYVICSDTENSLDTQVAFVPSVEVLVKALMVISSGVFAAAPSSCIRLLFCSHHPCLVGTAKKDAVWKVSQLGLCRIVDLLCCYLVHF